MHHSDDEIFLTPEQLMERWQGRIMEGTLANWRSQGKGPRHVKIGSKILYRLSDVKAFENESLQ